MLITVKNSFGDGRGPVRTEVSQPYRAGVILWLVVSSLN